MEAYYLSSTHTAVVTLADRDGEPVVGAVVELTIVDSSGDPVAGQDWPLELTDMGDGTYEGNVDHDLVVSNRDKLRARVVSSKGAARGFAEPTIKVVTDGK